MLAMVTPPEGISECIAQLKSSASERTGGAYGKKRNRDALSTRTTSLASSGRADRRHADMTPNTADQGDFFPGPRHVHLNWRARTLVTSTFWPIGYSRLNDTGWSSWRCHDSTNFSVFRPRSWSLTVTATSYSPLQATQSAFEIVPATATTVFLCVYSIAMTAAQYTVAGVGEVERDLDLTFGAHHDLLRIAVLPQSSRARKTTCASLATSRILRCVLRQSLRPETTNQHQHSDVIHTPRSLHPAVRRHFHRTAARRE